jgi:hypothetical protein
VGLTLPPARPPCQNQKGAKPCRASAKLMRWGQRPA